MSWLFPDSALEADLVDCVEYSMAMEGAFTDAFKRDSSARKEMKVHKKAMNEAILAGDYKTASSEAETCAKILRDAANEIKATKPSMISNILTDVALFAAIELAQVIFFLKAGKEDQKKIQDKYAELDLKVAGGHFDNSGVATLAIKHQKEYAETAEYMQTLNKKVQALVKDGKPVPNYLSEVNANQIFMSKVVGAERDGALQKAKKATNAGIAVGGLATALSMLGNQMYDLKRVKDGKISPAEANAILKTVVRSLDQTADAYEKKSREYKFIGNGFESDMAAQEGFFSNMKVKFNERKAKYARDAELNGYFTEMEQKLEHLYGGHDGVEAILKLYVEHCSDKLIKGTNSTMAKLLKAVDSFDLNQKDPWIYSTSGYIFLVSDPVDGDDSELVWLPTKANVDAVNRGKLDEAEYDEIWGSFDSNCIYLQICEAYAQKKYAETHPATESWIFNEPAQEGFFSDMKAKSAAKRAEREADAAARKAYHEKEQKYYDQIEDLYERQPAKAFAQAYSVLLDDDKDIASGPEAKKACDELCKIINDAEVVKVGRYFAVIQGDNYWVPSSDAKKTADDLKISQEIGDMANGHNIPDMFVDYVHEMMERQEAGAFESWIFNEPAQEGFISDKAHSMWARMQQYADKKYATKNRMSAQATPTSKTEPKIKSEEEIKYDELLKQVCEQEDKILSTIKEIPAGKYTTQDQCYHGMINVATQALNQLKSTSAFKAFIAYVVEIVNSREDSGKVDFFGYNILPDNYDCSNAATLAKAAKIGPCYGEENCLEFCDGGQETCLFYEAFIPTFIFEVIHKAFKNYITNADVYTYDGDEGLVGEWEYSIGGATESEVVSSMGELEKAQAFVSAWLECHADNMEPIYGPEADILLKEFRAKHVAEELDEDPDYVDPHEERHCGRLTYLVEVKPDTTNITIPVCWNNRNTTVEYGSKEIEESLCRYYDTAIQPQSEEVIAEPAQEGLFAKLVPWAKKQTTQPKASIISNPSTTRQRTADLHSFKHSVDNFFLAYKDMDREVGIEPIWNSTLLEGEKARNCLQSYVAPEDMEYKIETYEKWYYGYTLDDRGGVVSIILPEGAVKEIQPYRADWFDDVYNVDRPTPKERMEAFKFATKLAERCFLPLKQRAAPYDIHSVDYNDDVFSEFMQMSGHSAILMSYDWGEYCNNLPSEADETEMWNLMDDCAHDFAKQFRASKWSKMFFISGDGDKFEGYFEITTMDRYAALKKVYCVVESDMSAAQESFATKLAQKGFNAANKHLPKRVKDAQSAQRKEVNSQIKANLQHASNQKQFFKTAAQVMLPQKGWLLGDAGKAKCEEIAARQSKNADRVISAEVDNYSNLYYVLVHTKETGYDEWIMYIPQVAGVKTRNLHQAAREIALIQSGKKGQNVPGFESTVTFG